MKSMSHIPALDGAGRGKKAGMSLGSVVRALLRCGNKPATAICASWVFTWFVALGALGLLHSEIARGDQFQASDSWQELGPLNFGRWGCKAHSIDGHRAIAIAGAGAAAGSSAEILDTSTGIWTLTAPMPVGFRPGIAPWTAKLADGYFLVAGGGSALGSNNLSSYVYSVSSNTWIRTGDLPAGSTFISNLGQVDAIKLDDGRVLVAGGYTYPDAESTASMVFTPNYANLALGLSGTAAGTWDFTRDSGGQITRLSGPTEHHNLIKLQDGRVLLIVGYDDKFTFGNTTVYRDTPGVQAELFDPIRGTWTPLPDLPAIPGEDDRHDGVKGVRQLAAVALLADGRVLVSGGLSEPADNKGKPLLKAGWYTRSSAVVFDPNRFDAGVYPWEITGSMHAPRHSHVMGNLPGSAGTISVWGYTDSAWTGSAEIYDADQGVWRMVAGLPSRPGTDRAFSKPQGCSAMMPGGRMLVTGGVSDIETSQPSRRTYEYRP